MMGRKPTETTETNDTTGTEPKRKRGKREPKRYTVVQRGPRVFEVLDTGMDGETENEDGLFVVSATHKTARLARAVCRELNEE